MGIPFGIIDLSLAPTPAKGDSIADILELMGLEVTGAPGTTCALALLNDQVKKGGIMAARNVCGLSGAFIPVSEDASMINAVNKKALSIDKLVKQPFEGQKFIAWIDDDVTEKLCDLYNKGENVLVLIGPEGDFSPEEVALAKENGFVPCSLGDARLRTETAALVSCHTIQLINQMKS